MNLPLASIASRGAWREYDMAGANREAASLDPLGNGFIDVCQLREHRRKRLLAHFRDPPPWSPLFIWPRRVQ